jgi:hypothetical protein
MYDLVTKKPFLYMDYALTSTNEHNSEQVMATGGRGNPPRLSWDSNRTSTLSVSTQIIDFRLVALLAGSDVVQGAANVFKREVATAEENAGTVTITLTKQPVDGTLTVFPIANDAVVGEEVECTISGTTVTLITGEVGEYACYYQFESEVTAEKIVFSADKFPKFCKVVGDLLIKNENGVLEPFQMQANKCKPQPTFTFAMSNSGDPSTFEITFDLFADENNDMITYVKY